MAPMARTAKQRPAKDRGATAGPPSATASAAPFLLALALVVLTFVAHWPALGASFVWDDDVYLTQNPSLRDAAGLRDIWFRIGTTKMYVPAVFTTFWIEQRLWDLRPLGYHALNIALHALGALLLWRLLRRLGLPAAWWAAAAFAVHPVFVESVAWVTELKNTQSSVFALLCLLAYFRFSPFEEGAPRQRHFYWLALAAFAAALLSKPVVVGLPLVILALVWWKRGRVERSDLLAVAPMLAMSLAAGLVAMHVERLYGGARGADWELPLLARVLVAGRALWFYLGKLVWPFDLLPIYPRWAVSTAAWWQFLFPLGALVAAAALWTGRQRWGRGPAAAVATFSLLVAPLIGIFNVSYHLHSYVADHFQHHAAPALFALFAAGGALLHARLSGRSRWLVPAAGGLLLALLAGLSVRHARAFHDEEARSRATLTKNPDSWVALNNLGAALNARRAYAEAAPWLERAIAKRSPYPEAHNNLGVALVGLGRPQDAIAHYLEALRVFPDNPLAHNNLGTALAQTGKIDEAIAEYRIALRLNPGYAEASANLAQLTDSAEAHNRRGKELATQGKIAEAIAEFAAAVRLRPADADLRNDLGTALASRGDLEGALREYGEAVRLAPGNASARVNLARVLLSKGRPADALPHLLAAVRIRPRDAGAHSALGVALAQTGRLDEAIAAFGRAVEIDPGDREAVENLERARAVRRANGAP